MSAASIRCAPWCRHPHFEISFNSVAGADEMVKCGDTQLRGEDGMKIGIAHNIIMQAGRVSTGMSVGYWYEAANINMARYWYTGTEEF